MYVLTGMLNSGTSMAAQYLEHLGVDMGSDRQPDPGAVSYMTYEDLRFRRVTYQILKDSGLTHWPSLYIRPGRVRAAESTLADLGDVVKGRPGETWGFKEPYNSLTLPVWAPELLKSGHTPIIVHLYREPSEVIDSVIRHRAELGEIYPDLAYVCEFWWRVFNRAVLDFHEANADEYEFHFVFLDDLVIKDRAFCASLGFDYRPLADIRDPDLLGASSRATGHPATQRIWEQLRSLSS